jgi:hypothetical protein
MTANGKISRLVQTLEGNWQAEMSGFYTYSTLAQREVDPQRRIRFAGWPMQRSITPNYGRTAFRPWEVMSLSTKDR